MHRAACMRLSDGAVVLRAYERWGAQAPARLFGDWSFAAWHADERRLVLARANGRRVVTKAGAFGDDGTLLRVLHGGRA